MKTETNFMKRALELAEKGRGSTLPNPMVGAVIVKDGEIIGEGYHEFCGGPHGEEVAINSATEDLKGSTLYVTLEPCSHFGKRPPCANLIVETGIKKVVVAMEDPNPKVSGKGIEILKENGIEVEVGLLEEEAKELNKAFLHYIKEKTPYVFYKGAMTLDGKVSTRTGDSRNISCEESMRLVHKWRDEYQGIMVGLGTVMADDPRLTARLPNSRSPIRIIIDTRLRIPEDAKLLSIKESETWIYTVEEIDLDKKARIESYGNVKVISLPKGEKGRVDLDRVMKDLGEKEIASVFLEGGPNLAASMLATGNVNQLAYFISPRLIGGGGINILSGVGVDYLKDAYKLENLKVSKSGSDILIEGDIK